MKKTFLVLAEDRLDLNPAKGHTVYLRVGERVHLDADLAEVKRAVRARSIREVNDAQS